MEVHTAASTAALDAIAAVHTRTLDALAGFETMVNKAEPEFRATAEQFRQLHAEHAQAIGSILAAAGREPDNDGSFMSTINRAVVSMRAFVDEIDEDVLTQIHSGEQSVIDAFDAALAEDMRAESHSKLREMRTELLGLLARHAPVA